MQFQLAPQHLPISAEQEICANCNSNNNNCQQEVNEEEERGEEEEEDGEDEAEAAEQLLAKNRTHPRSSLTQNHYVIKVAITADSKNRKLEHGTQTGWRRRPQGECGWAWPVQSGAAAIAVASAALGKNKNGK